MSVLCEKDVENFINLVKRNPTTIGSSRKYFGNSIKRNFIDMLDNGGNLAEVSALLSPNQKKAFEDAVLKSM